MKHYGRFLSWIGNPIKYKCDDLEILYMRKDRLQSQIREIEKQIAELEKDFEESIRGDWDEEEIAEAKSKKMKALLVHFENHVTAWNDDDELILHKFEFEFVPTTYSVEFNAKFLKTFKTLRTAVKFFNAKAEEHSIDLDVVLEEFEREKGEQRCRICGCTDMDCRGCIERTGEACHWVEYDLCSACR